MVPARSSIENKIYQTVDAVVRQISSEDDTIAQAVIGRQADVHLLINSSFLSRDKRSVRTLQSTKRLVTRLAVNGKRIGAGAVSIADDRKITAHYRLLPPQDISSLVSLEDAVARELAAIGDLLFVLIGKVEGLRPWDQLVESESVKLLRLDPSLGTDFEKIDFNCYGVRKILPVEELLDSIGHDLRESGGLSSRDRQGVAMAYEKLLDAATTLVTVPTGLTVRPKETILGQIVDSLRIQTNEYRSALQALRNAPEDRGAQNEVLRLAYNFSTDALPLISLFMSICDLKPLVFWCTVDKQWALRRAFGSLPWAALGRKESMEDYRNIVSGARNSAFHHLLPFEATLEIDLTQVDVRAETIRLFAPYGQKNGSGVRLKDQALADLLGDFSRAKQRPVSIGFWQANLRLVEAASDLARGVLEALILFHEARTSGTRQGRV
jgi:hypothetical protein